MLSICAPPPKPVDETDDEHFERAVSVAASLIDLLMRKETRVGLWTTSGLITPGTGQRHLRRMLRALAEVQALAPDTRPAPLGIRRSGTTLVAVQWREQPFDLAEIVQGGVEDLLTVDARRVREAEPAPKLSSAP